ncbi:hypothetical protein FGO68_gene6701 [Halteria grandinella]|uniref:Uncharacterized protein n=1 Tax=Halteria grandinella TaxID=5974 RepID=A0A8J8NV52_HALGN|nr:hypothetical protein FGO68_gene6701 [Halteria grandinella]
MNSLKAKLRFQDADRSALELQIESFDEQDFTLQRNRISYKSSERKDSSKERASSQDKFTLRKFNTAGAGTSQPFALVEPKKFKVPESLKQQQDSSSNFDESFMNFDAIAAVSQQERIDRRHTSMQIVKRSNTSHNLKSEIENMTLENTQTEIITDYLLGGDHHEGQYQKRQTTREKSSQLIMPKGGQSAPKGRFMSKIIEEEEAIEEANVNPYFYVKNEGLPSHITKTFSAHSEGSCISFSPCGSILVTAGGNEVKSWREEFYGSEFKLSQSISNFPKPVNLVEFSPNIKLLAVSTLDSQIRVLNTQNFKLSNILTGHKDVINGLSFLSQSQLVSGSADRMIRIWDLTTGKALDSIFSRSIVKCVDVSQQSKIIASGHQDGKLRLWSYLGTSPTSASGQSGKSLNMCKEIADFHDDTILSIFFSKTDAHKLLSLSSDGTLKLVDIRMEKVLKNFSDSGYLSFSSYGSAKVLISAGEQLAVAMTSNGAVVAYSVEKEEAVGVLGKESMGRRSVVNEKMGSNLKDFSWQPRGHKVATIDNKGMVSIWD